MSKHNYEIKCLESIEYLKRVLKASVGNVPSSELARQISTCIQQGRMFYEAAAEAPLEIKPLLIFYGIVGFSKGIILGRNFKKIEALPQSHGLSDVSPSNARLEDLELKVATKGTFQVFNDVITEFDGVQIYIKTMPSYISTPSSKAKKLNGMKISLKSILSRMPGLEEEYSDTFRNMPSVWPCIIHAHNGYVTIRIDDTRIFTDKKSLFELVEKWRRKYPFLNDWCLVHGSRAWGKSVIEFANINRAHVKEDDESFLVEIENGFDAEREVMLNEKKFPRVELRKLLSHPFSGGLGASHPHLIERLEKVQISELSLQYMGMFLLSSLVRYRPQTWINSITRLSTKAVGPDDNALALLELFLERVMTTFPEYIAKAFRKKI